jgi:uncharacterized membrane protein
MEAGKVELAADGPTPIATHARGLPAGAAFGWLRAGWKDLVDDPGPSLAYGLVVFAVSLAVTGGLLFFDLSWILFPAIAAFLVVGPLIAIGLYQKSRLIEVGQRATFGRMIFVRPESGGQIGFIGVIMLGLALLWMRAAVILYALFFGVRPFPGFDHIASMLFTTPLGWAMLATGAVVGGVFAAFSFAISAFSLPMLLDQRTDAFTAMGTSIAIAWTNRPVLIAWGAIVTLLTALGLATGFLGLIVVFPLIGHATWHAYRAMR